MKELLIDDTIYLGQMDGAQLVISIWIILTSAWTKRLYFSNDVTNFANTSIRYCKTFEIAFNAYVHVFAWFVWLTQRCVFSVFINTSYLAYFLILRFSRTVNLFLKICEIPRARVSFRPHYNFCRQERRFVLISCISSFRLRLTTVGKRQIDSCPTLLPRLSSTLFHVGQ